MQTRPAKFLPFVISALAACTGPDGPSTAETRPPDQLNIVWLAGDHPAFYGTEISFWGRHDQDAEGSLYFQDEHGGRGEEYARLRIRQGSLKAFPDGHLFGAQDSVLITMRVADQTKLLIELLPSGLKFNASIPAELRLEYDHDDPDLNHDGSVDSQDVDLQHQLSFWVQEVLNGAFTKVASINSESIQEMEAALLGFSRLAIAY